MTQGRWVRHAAYFDRAALPTPCLIVDLDVVAQRYAELRAELPQAEVYYAVKANPHPSVIDTLRDLGARFDVASPAEIDLCLARGVHPADISYGNTIKRTAQIAYAFERGVRMFAFDSEEELRKLAAVAPGATVFCRVLVSSEGAQWPLSKKFGCAPDMASDLLLRALRLGLRPAGISFHVGSQQLNPSSWESGIRLAADICHYLSRYLTEPWLVNLGGGFPARYAEVPSVAEYGKAIGTALNSSFEGAPHRVIVEPGRFLVADAGMIRSSVILVSRKSYTDKARWVYVDIGRFGGLAETEGEAIRYPILTSPARDGATGPVILAGPSCDSADILYQQTPYYLATDLQEGDYIDFLSAGAYTATYSSVGFNGFPPLPTFVFGGAS